MIHAGRFNGRIAVVTGAAQGIGRTVAVNMAREGARVALLMPNAPVYVELLYACWWAGLAIVPVNAKLHSGEIAWILEHSGARAAH